MQSLKIRIKSFLLQQIYHEGSRISYRDTEADKKNISKETIVLLHGIGSGSASWLYQLEELSRRYRVIAWDAPGYGESTPLELKEPDASSYARSLLEMLNRLNVIQCYMVGHSLGAIIASRFAREHPERVRGLILANPARGYGAQTEERRNQVKQTRGEAITAMRASGLAKQRSHLLLASDSCSEAKELVYHNMSSLNIPGYLQAVHLLAYADLIKDVAALKVPIAVYCGDQDRITPAVDARAVAGSNSQASYRQINDAGHASYIDQPGVFNSLLCQFVSQIKE